MNATCVAPAQNKGVRRVQLPWRTERRGRVPIQGSGGGAELKNPGYTRDDPLVDNRTCSKLGLLFTNQPALNLKRDLREVSGGGYALLTGGHSDTRRRSRETRQGRHLTAILDEELQAALRAAAA